MQEKITQAIQEIAKRKNATDWASQDNLLAKIEAIRLKARQDILALGFDENEVSVDVSLFSLALGVPEGADGMAIFHLAKELGWKTRHSWYEPPVLTEGGDITIYYEPAEQAW